MENLKKGYKKYFFYEFLKKKLLKKLSQRNYIRTILYKKFIQNILHNIANIFEYIMQTFY